MNQTFKITEKKARCLNLESYEKSYTHSRLNSPHPHPPTPKKNPNTGKNISAIIKTPHWAEERPVKTSTLRPKAQSRAQPTACV